MSSKLPLPDSATCTVAVIGLGYVGLPLAVEFAKSKVCSRTGIPLDRSVIGFDTNHSRLSELKNGIDRTNETTTSDLEAANSLQFTSEILQLSLADVFIITVPTPIDSAKRPDLSPLKSASITVGRVLRERQKHASVTTPIVIYESTVFPGATEEECVPILESESGLSFNQDFVCGYSPERINPGDKEHRLRTITKVTSGSTTDSSVWIDDFYGSIIDAGTHRASSIKVAEAAKVIENTQRDLNIALVNELAVIFRELHIDTLDVLEAAGTKWNFLPFRPGLVGGHCIGVDPYYLTFKAEKHGYHPQVVLAGRRINDGMGRWVVEQIVLDLARNGAVIADSRVLVLGLSFKENCPDLRNTRVADLLESLKRYRMKPEVVDPWVDPEEAKRSYQVSVISKLSPDVRYDIVLLAVAHDQFINLTADEWRSLILPGGIFVDLKGCMPRELSPLRI